LQTSFANNYEQLLSWMIRTFSTLRFTADMVKLNDPVTTV